MSWQPKEPRLGRSFDQKKPTASAAWLADWANVNSSSRKHLHTISTPVPFKTRLPDSSNVTSNTSNATSNASNVTSNQCREMSHRDLTHWGTFQACPSGRRPITSICQRELQISRGRKFGLDFRFWHTLWIDSVATYSLTPLVKNGFGLGRE